MRYLIVLLSLAAGALAAAPATRPDPNFVNPLERTKDQMSKDGDVLVIEEAMVVEGKIEKPQVMMTVTKEKPKFLTDQLQADFVLPVTRPLEENTFNLEKMLKNNPSPEGK